MGTFAAAQGDNAGNSLLDNTLLIVDDDKPFLTRLAKAMEARGYHVRTADFRRPARLLSSNRLQPTRS